VSFANKITATWPRLAADARDLVLLVGPHPRLCGKMSGRLRGKMSGNDECGDGKRGRVETVDASIHDTDDSDKIEGVTDGAARETTESWVRRLRVLHHG